MLAFVYCNKYASLSLDPSARPASGCRGLSDTAAVNVVVFHDALFVIVHKFPVHGRAQFGLSQDDDAPLLVVGL